MFKNMLETKITENGKFKLTCYEYVTISRVSGKRVSKTFLEVKTDIEKLLEQVPVDNNWVLEDVFFLQNYFNKVTARTAFSKWLKDNASV